MSLHNRIIEFQNRAERQLKERKSLGNLAFFVVAFATFILSNFFALARLPFAIIFRRSQPRDLETGRVNIATSESFDDAKNQPQPLLVKFGTEW